MRDLPLKKLRNFGGKLGAELEAMGCTTAGQVMGRVAVLLLLQLGFHSVLFLCGCHLGATAVRKAAEVYPDPALSIRACEFFSLERHVVSVMCLSRHCLAWRLGQHCVSDT